jgi:hypothetical protein
VTNPGRETGDLPLPFDPHPRDRDPRERVERITLEREPARGEDDDDGLVIHAPTVMPAA